MPEDQLAIAGVSAVFAFNTKALSTSVFVYVVDWFAFDATALSTCVFVYVLFKVGTS